MSVEAPVKTAPLLCGACGSAVPLSDADRVTCPSCGAKVEVPESYRALARSHRELVADHAKLQAAYQALGEPPGRLLKVWGAIGTAVMAPIYLLVAALRAGWFLALPAVGLVIFGAELLSHWLAPRLGVDVVDVYGSGAVYAALGALVVVGALVPVMIVSNYDDVADVKKALRKSLAAKLPDHAGGPSLCRNCGAPLDVPKDAVGVRCLYCQTDNLVAVPTQWLAESTKAEVQNHSDAAAALADLDKARAGARSLTTGLVMVGVVSVGVLWVVGRVALWLDYDLPAPPSWASHRVLDIFDDKPLPLERPMRASCDPANCSIELYAALDKGDVVWVESPDLPSSTRSGVKTATTFPDLALKDEVAWSIGPDGNYRAAFQAPYKGYFVLGLYAKKKGLGQATLIAHVGRAAPAEGEPAPPAVTRRTIDAHAGPLERVVFSPDGARLAAASDDDLAYVFDVASGKLIEKLNGHSASVYDVAWRPDGAELATASVDKTVKIWDAKDGKLLQTVAAHDDVAESVAWSPQGTLLASAGKDGVVKIWNAAAGFSLEQALPPQDAAVTRVAFGSKGKRLVSVGPAASLCLWTKQGETWSTEPTTLDARGVWLAISPDGAWLASPDELDDGSVDLWRANGKKGDKLAGDARTLEGAAFAPDPLVLATAALNGTVELWDTRQGKLLSTLALFGVEASSVAFSPDGRWLAVGRGDGKVALFDLAPGATWTSHGGEQVVSGTAG